uniref:Ribosomal protein L13 n=1 Tax=Cryptomonas curvata TaxID=233186 RepID=A0A7S0M6S2_9CRYP|nr:60S ribosomal protein L13 [Cryptomonas curvata]|mmetsp:Transcript_27326/g.56822  ORF Transcript_27326/g.56822 Transcript_27326/m.56822 type:complete len:157 (+) Transcript_27326:59-529(+)
MVKHNNKISNGHFRKHWQSFVKTWFDQPANKRRRRIERLSKEKIHFSNSSIVNKFRPLVHCPTHMHNMKIRFGRGFSLNEITKAKIGKGYSNSMGINIDKRRRKNNLFENYNIKRLTEYLEKIVILKKKDKKCFDKPSKIYSILNKNFYKKKINIF